MSETYPIMPQDQIVNQVTREYLDSLDSADLPEPQEITAELLGITYDKLMVANRAIPNNIRYRISPKLTPNQIALVLLRTKAVRILQLSDFSQDPDLLPIGIYQDTGPHNGLYSIRDADIDRAILELSPGASKKDINEVKSQLQSMAPVVRRSSDPNLVPVDNGIFDYKNQLLMDFSPDYVFLSKVAVPYNPQAANVPIYDPNDGTWWDVDSWMQELFDDPEKVNLLWHLIGAVVRGNVGWNQMAMFYSSTGNNGKGTVLAMLKALVGRESCASIRMADMDKDFALEPILQATCILTDENNVGEYIDRSSNMKSLVTGDSMPITRKFRNTVTFQFRGFMIQCFNDMPRVRDRTDSFLRRCLIVEFDKCFTGREKKYIKDDYLTRAEVLEYILYRVLSLMPQYYTLPTTKVCKTAADDFSAFNNPVVEFALEILPKLQSRVMSFIFLYDLYKNWLKDGNPSSTPVGRNTFIADLIRAIQKPPLNSEWRYPGRDANGKHKRILLGAHPFAAEPIFIEYGVTNPLSLQYEDKTRVAGIERIVAIQQQDDDLYMHKTC